MTARFAMIERAKSKFEELDTDKSGFLEAAELDICVQWALQAYKTSDPSTYKEKMMSKVDWNKDGKLDVLGTFKCLLDLNNHGVDNVSE